MKSGFRQLCLALNLSQRGKNKEPEERVFCELKSRAHGTSLIWESSQESPQDTLDVPGIEAYNEWRCLNDRRET